MLFTGEYVHTIDAKQRLAIPSTVRNHIEHEKLGTRFFLGPGANGALWLWPEATFRQMAAALDEDRSPLPEDEQLVWEEILFSQSDQVEMDKTGRIRVPERKLVEYELGQRVVILGVNDHLELRNADRWEAERAEKLAMHQTIVRNARRALRRKLHEAGGEEDGP